MNGCLIARFALEKVVWLRRLVIPLFARINLGDISIRHHYTDDFVKLHSFKHKGYWYHGKAREQETMHAFKDIISPGDRILEVGGHIGYITQWFSRLVGSTGEVIVFEPSEENRAYLTVNVAGKANIVVRAAALSERVGHIKFYLDNTSGQNNSILENYDQARTVAESAGIPLKKRVVEVESDTLDNLYLQGLKPTLIKIDVEGAEMQVLNGGRQMLGQLQPMLMVEVTNHQTEVFDLLTDSGYKLFSPHGEMITTAASLNDNIFGFASRDWKKIERFLSSATKRGLPKVPTR